MTDQTPYQNVTFPSNGGTAHGYLAVPDSGRGPGLIVIQEWWGLTDHIVGATAVFYGTFSGDEDFTAVVSPVLAVVGGQDAFTPPDQARAVLDRISGPGDVQVYDAGHAFFNDENLLGTYDEDQARQAWTETVGFLRRQLAG